MVWGCLTSSHHAVIGYIFCTRHGGCIGRWCERGGRSILDCRVVYHRRNTRPSWVEARWFAMINLQTGSADASRKFGASSKGEMFSFMSYLGRKRLRSIVWIELPASEMKLLRVNLYY